MKANSYLLAAALTASSSLVAANTPFRAFPENPTPYTIVTEPGIKWTLEVQTVLDEDSGDQKLRLTHLLEAPILKTDEVKFELSFSAASYPAVLDATIPGEDMSHCALAISKEDDRFWVETLVDGYYQCTDASAVLPAPADWCDHVNNNYKDGNRQLEPSENTNWVVPFEDDNPDEPFCTPNTNLEYKCSKIKCVLERVLDSKDTAGDIPFKPTGNDGTTTDTMVIKKNRAQLFFNISQYEHSVKGPKDTTLEIIVYAGAYSLTASALAVAAATMLSF